MIDEPNKKLVSFIELLLKVIAYFASILSIFVVVGSILTLEKPMSLGFLSIICTLLLGTSFSIYVIYSMMNKKHPTSLIISLIGFPNSGKTVYLSVIFNEFFSSKHKNIEFSPYGSETTDIITANMSQLKRGFWLNKTEIFSMNRFFAIVSISSNLSKKRYKIEIQDYPGELTNSFNQKIWLHKSEYFKTIIFSDIIYLIIDGSKLLDQIYQAHSDEIIDLQYKYISILQELIKQKNVEIGKKMKTPVGLIITKCDLFFPDNLEVLSQTNGVIIRKFDYTQLEPKISEQLNIIIPYCQKNCANFKFFLVSSVGFLDNEYMPTIDIKPINVIDPIIWGLNLA